MSVERLKAWIAERHMSPSVAERILRLNPDPQPGEMLRGWHPAPSIRKSIHKDVVTRAQFDARWGKGSARRIKPFLAKHFNGGKRRWIPGEDFIQGPAR